MQLAVYTVVSAIINIAFAYPNGSPQDACQNLWPQHGSWLKSQRGENFPFNVEAVPVAEGDFGYTWQITMSSASDGEYYRGIILQVREQNNTVGSFKLKSDETGLRLLSCTKDSDTVTHANPYDKNNLSVMWSRSSPSEFENIADVDLEITLTVLKYFDVFWANFRVRLVSNDRDEL